MHNPPTKTDVKIIYKWVDSSYYLGNLDWQMTSSPVWLVISYTVYDDPACTAIFMTSGWHEWQMCLYYSMNQGHMISVQIWRCLVAWIAVDVSSAVYFEDALLFFFWIISYQRISCLYTNTHMHLYTEKALSRTRRWQYSPNIKAEGMLWI